MTIRNVARERLDRGELSLGIGLRFSRSVDIAAIARSSGFDWLFIDLEHSAMSIDTASQIAVAALDAGIAPLARVTEGNYGMATRLLDGGGLGIVMPHVDTPQQAAELVERLRYPPDGHRSVAGGMPQVGFRSLPAGEVTRQLNAATLVTVMLETPVAIDNADAIAAVPGVDVVMIGTSDLSMEYGVPGEVGHARIVSAYEKVIAACRKHRKHPGMGGVGSEELMKKYVGMGMRFILAGGDTGFLMQAATQRTNFLRGCL
jgi:2-keto-3-deoxy-L-rhamnonate aldolase RhmA